MVGWMDDEALHRTLTTGRVDLLVPQPAGVLGQGRHERALQHVRSRGRSTATATRCWSRSTRSARPATPATAPASTPATSAAQVASSRDRRQPRPVLRHDLARACETFRRLAKDRRVIPVVRRLLADGETPIGVYRKLAGTRPGTFLLESAEHGGVWSRYSFIGVRAAGPR